MLRFSSSFTGDMHIGNLRLALLNYMVAQQNSEEMLVRNQDTEILDLLALFDIRYSQVIEPNQNIRFHSAMALQLMHDKQAFSCFCSTNWLDKKRKEAKENNKDYRYDDACKDLPDELVIDNMSPFTIRIKGDISLENGTVDSFIIMNQEKISTPNFACAVDDMLSDISIVIDTQECIDDALKQNHIRNLLKYDKKIKYFHIPNILNESDFSVKGLLEEGYLPSAISNYLISIGYETPCEIFSVEEATKWLSLESMSKSTARFNMETLRDINKKHLKALDDVELSRYVGFADASVGKLAKIYLEKEVSTTKELKAKIAPIFAPKEIPQELIESSNRIIQAVKKAPYFDKYDEFKNHILKESKLKDKELLEPLRFVLTGAKNGPDIALIYQQIKNYIGEIVK